MTALPVGPNALALIVAQEVGGEHQYTSEYTHPTWPGGDSGVTWGIGYDASGHTDAQIIKDWLPSLGVGLATILSRCSGLSGVHAQTALRFVRGIVVPWVDANAVFVSSTLPAYAAQTEAALPNCDLLPPDAFGALVSIGYNRGNGGWTINSRHYAEMWAIHEAMVAKQFGGISTQIRHMQRLWPAEGDLWKRREAEAALFDQAMKAQGTSP